MSNPLPADGQPIPEGLVAAVDETVVELQAAPAFDYDWRTKAEPCWWYTDALAGVIREQLTEGRSTGFSFLQGTRTVTGVRYGR